MSNFKACSNSEYNTGLQVPVCLFRMVQLLRLLCLFLIVFLGFMKEFVTKLKFAEVHSVHKSHYVMQMLNRIALQCSLSMGKDLVGNNDHWQGGFIFDSHLLGLN